MFHMTIVQIAKFDWFRKISKNLLKTHKGDEVNTLHI